MTFYDLDTVFTFGKYKGETLRDVFERDPAYVDYCLVNVDEFLVEDFVLDDLREINPDYPISDEALAQVDEKWNRYEADAYNNDDDFYIEDDADLYGEPSGKGRSSASLGLDDGFDDDGFEDEFASLDEVDEDDYENDYDDNW